jgi:predicted unusual protein kinase regulating ubiquinone biosynthesis (AarF/ABC1/UbiB family)
MPLHEPVRWALLLGAAALVAALALIVAIVRRARRRSAAGISMTRAGRLLAVGSLVLGAAGRRARRFFGGLFLSRARREARDRALEAEAAAEIAQAMGNMKGALMKVAQIVSFMDEAVPEAFRAELSKLQAQAPPMRWEVVEATLRLELGGDLGDRFQEIDPEPLAAASIGQVHRAVLRDGTRVAVKVQYPGVEQAIAADLANYEALNMVLQAVTPTADVRPVAAELRARLGEELDYENEARNQEAFREIYEGHPRVVVPRVLREHSSRRVLLTELVEGGADFNEFCRRASAEEKRDAVKTIHAFAFDSIYGHYIFNGDPHPGNYLFLPGGRVAFLDFGCVKRFPPEFVEALRDLNRLYLLGEREAYRQQMIAMGYILPAAFDKVDADWLFEYMRYYYLPILEDAPFAVTSEYCHKAIAAMFGPAMRRLNMPGDFVLLNRINFGLNSIFARLGARENFHRMARRHFFREGDDERYERSANGRRG